MMIPKLGKRTKNLQNKDFRKILDFSIFLEAVSEPFSLQIEDRSRFCLGGSWGGNYMSPKVLSKTWAFLSVHFRPSNWSWNEYRSCVSLRRGGKSSLFAYQIPTPARLSVTMVLKIHTKTCMVMILKVWIVMMPEGDSPVAPIQWDARNKTC